MRITYRTVNRQMQYVIQDRYADLAALQEQLSTGKRLLRPSDQPTDVANSLQLRTKIRQLEQRKKNMDDGLGFMQITDSALTSMDSLLQRLRELAIQASSDTMSGKERGFIAEEVQQLLRQFISLSDSMYKGDYIFAGTQTKIMPFPLESSVAGTAQDYANLSMSYYDSSGGAGIAAQLREGFNGDPITNIIPGTFKLSASGVTYLEGTDYTVDYVNGTITINPASPAAALLAVDVQNGINPLSANPYYSQGEISITFEFVGKGEDIYGDTVDNTGLINREIENGITMPINITADELLVDLASGNNLMESIVAFGESLLHDNRTDIVNSISKIDTGLKTLLSAQAKNGARINRFDITLERNEVQNIETTRLNSDLEDAELAETATRFSVAETVYNAALQSAAKIIQPSLVNFL